MIYKNRLHMELRPSSLPLLENNNTTYNNNVEGSGQKLSPNVEGSGQKLSPIDSKTFQMLSVSSAHNSPTIEELPENSSTDCFRIIVNNGGVSPGHQHQLQHHQQVAAAAPGTGAPSRMLSEGRPREGLRLALNRSLSEPGDATPVSRCPVSLPHLMAPQVLSMPASPCGDSQTIQRSLLLKKARALDPAEVARRLTKTQHKMKTFLLLDLRPFMAYNRSHVRSAINLNCSDRFNRRRLQLRRASVVDLAASPHGRDLLKKRCFKEIIVYDDYTTDLEALPPQHPVYLVLMALLEDNREPLLLKGGFQAFESAYPELCEDALMRSRAPEDTTITSTPMVQLPGGQYDPFSMTPCGGNTNNTQPMPLLPPSPGNESTIEQAPAAEVLPFLYLGNARDAQDLQLLQALGISRILNVTAHVPGFHQESGVLTKTLPALDSGHQNLRQFFDEAIHFIDECRQNSQGVLVHCQAGVSRSPTIVIAYLMKHTRMTMLDSYTWVKRRRQIISPNLNFMGQLVDWEHALQQDKTEADCKPCHQCQWEQQEPKKIPNACQV